MPHFRHRSVEFHCKSDRGVNIDLVREMLYSVEDLLSPEFGLSEGLAQSLHSFAHPIALAAGPLQMMKAEAESSVLCPTGISSLRSDIPSRLRRAVQIKTKREPSSKLEVLFYFYLRWEGDSNPRYSYPYVSLANWWFQPLTHLTKLTYLD